MQTLEYNRDKGTISLCTYSEDGFLESELDITDKVTALKLGADDYLPKPYDPRELEVRIKTILRRFNNSQSSEEDTKSKIFVLNEEKREITKNGKFIKLTAAEFEVLSLLIKREGLKQTELAEKLNIDRRSVSQSMKMFDENRGTIKTLMEYANALGYDVKIEFEKKEEKIIK